MLEVPPKYSRLVTAVCEYPSGSEDLVLGLVILATCSEILCSDIFAHSLGLCLVLLRYDRNIEATNAQNSRVGDKSKFANMAQLLFWASRLIHTDRSILIVTMDHGL